MLPNLLILGAAKSGTSSLYRYLGQHPQVFMSRFKEPTFFVWEGREYDIRGPGVERIGKRMVKDIDSYLRLFSAATHERIRGEGSTGYLHTPGVAERIRDHVPDVRLMAILRNPIDRAYSAFLHARRLGLEPVADFGRALDKEPDRVRSGWIGLTTYATVGMYAEQLERYLAVFPCQQIRIYLFEDLIRDPIRLAQDAFRYLGVDDSFEPDVSIQVNRGSAVRSARLASLFTTLRNTSFGQGSKFGRSVRTFVGALNEQPKGQLAPSVRRRLAAVFEPDVDKLSGLLGRDLSPWLKGRTVVANPPGAELGAYPCVRD
jgi:Sulfotransferase family